MSSDTEAAIENSITLSLPADISSAVFNHISVVRQGMDLYLIKIALASGITVKKEIKL